MYFIMNPFQLDILYDFVNIQIYFIAYLLKSVIILKRYIADWSRDTSSARMSLPTTYLRNQKELVIDLEEKGDPKEF